MTVIEFFDKKSEVENIVSTLLCKPEKVVFIGGNSKRMLRSIEKYRIVAKNRGINTVFEIKTVQANNLMSIVSVIEDIIGENADCVVDLSGGDDLCLVAVGVVYAENADTLKMHRFSISNNRMNDCDSDGVLCVSETMEISAEENVMIYGGRVIYADEKNGGTYNWNFSSEFVDDIYAMWSLCKKNPSRWNLQIKTLDKLCRENNSNNKLNLSADISQFKKVTDNAVLLRDLTDTLKKLSSYGVISNLKINDSEISLIFKNEQVKKCLTKSGQILELVIAVAAHESDDEKGMPVYNDVVTGLCIDWDGEVQHENKADVENEIDVVLMKGMVPVFVSCKNGMVTVDELYKLFAVADRFGGKFARRVLVATELEKLGSKEHYIRARAESMGIRIIDDADILSTEALQKKIKTLWRN